MPRMSRVTIALASLLCSSVCGTSLADPPEASASEQQPLISDIAEAPNPLLSPTLPAGWVKRQTQPLPAADHGFTVAYQHESGLVVTFYQYTRGLVSIPEDVGSAPVRDEMRYAKQGIKQVVQLGHWQDAKHLKTEVVQLGDSQQQALWAKYKLMVDGMALDSEIYIWTRDNTLFKVRSTNPSETKEASRSILKPLLTTFGTR
ncbi:hypothetical protein MalM25_27320 [Planctomycetes bacterium MalM25]|nr:hypothetical protein MalM25_27320 [Planctomycetes bacterium MalM25]